MREGVVLRLGVDDVAIVVEQQLHLRQVQHDHAVAVPALLDHAGERVAPAQRLDQLVGVRRVGAGVLAGRSLVAVDECLGFKVGEPLVGPDDARCQPLVEHLALLVERDEGRLGEARHALLQRAHAVGEHLRQHRDHQPGQVHAVAALPRLAVERPVPGHEVRHVGDVHAELPLAGRGIVRDGDRVVEVLGVRRVDRDREDLLQVLAAGLLLDLLVEHAGGLARLLDGALRELGAETVRHDDRLRLDVRLARLAQHARDHALGHVVAVGIVQQLDDHLAADFGVLHVRVADQHRLVQRAAAGRDEPAAAALEQHADERVAAALQHLLDLANGAAAAGPGLVAPLLADHRRPHAVARDGVASSAARDEQVALARRRVGHHEAEAAGVEPELAHDLVAEQRQPQLAVAIDVDLLVVLEDPQGLLEDRQLILFDAEIARDIAGHGRPVAGVAEVIEDSAGEAKRHGVEP